MKQLWEKKSVFYKRENIENMVYSYIQQGGVKFDVLKFILAMLIVAMHSYIFPHWLLPLPRLAVPLFFLMTSYFFHLKMKKAISKEEKNANMKKYFLRNAKLYLFWSIILLPSVIVFHLSWFNNGVVNGVIQFLKAFFITGFFPASWFIVAAAYSVIIVFYLSKRLNNLWLFVIALLIYSAALFASNYGGLLDDKSKDILNVMGISWNRNIPAALIWVVIGKILADKSFTLPFKRLYSLLALTIALYIAESIVINYYQISVHTDCFVMSIPLCTLIFIAIGQSSDIQCKYSLWLRKSSIIIYCVHRSVFSMISLVGSTLFGVQIPTLIIYFTTLIISIGVAYIVIFLHEKKKIQLLRYAY